MLYDGIYDRLLTLADEKDLEAEKIKIKETKSVSSDPEGISAIVNFIKEALREYINEHEDDKNLLPTLYKILNQTIKELPSSTLSAPINPLTLLQEIRKSELTPSYPRPTLPLNVNQIFTGVNGEIPFINEIKAEIKSADTICFFISFIKYYGFLQIEKDLEEFLERGGRLTILTSTYIGATESRALEEFAKLKNTHIKICYNSKKVRMHAKAFIFKRNNGCGSAYVGSSNLSRSALNSGLEWNIKISELYDYFLYQKVLNSFDFFLNSPDFEDFSGKDEEIEKLRHALQEEKNPKNKIANAQNTSFFNIKPYDYQQEILDKLAIQRSLYNRNKNLIVAATGTGKTVIAAFDYLRFRQQQDKNKQTSRLLFVAHRKEILEQALQTFRYILRDPNFGEICCSGEKPISRENLFITIQSLDVKNICTVNGGANFYDFIIVDEAHHGGAESYQDLFKYLRPKILLGLTATPERNDDRQIFQYFDDGITAAIRLPQALEKGLLCPFAYFGISDTVDLSSIAMKNGEYDTKQLEKIFIDYTKSALYRASIILKTFLHYVDNIDNAKALGFCVNIRHAEYMANYFNQNSNIKALALNSHSNQEERANAKRNLIEGKISIIFTVDLYNEGVDIPQVNTVLFLRPTNSLTIFLQQLGRGLRLYPGKDHLVVLDFIAKAARNFNYSTRFQALLSKGSKSLQDEIKDGFINLPPNCFIELQKEAMNNVLENIKSAQNTDKNLTTKIIQLRDQIEKVPSLQEFIDYYQLDLGDIYNYKRSFNSLLANASILKEDFYINSKQGFQFFQKISQINSQRFLSFIKNSLKDEQIDINNQFFKMLLISYYRDEKNGDIEDFRKFLFSKNVKNELQQLIKILENNIDVPLKPLTTNSPLDLYGTYTRDQLLSALDYDNPTTQVKGHFYDKKNDINILMVTLHKSLSEYSENTLYEDYAIDNQTFHWQTSNNIRVKSKEGQRLINSKNNMLLFVREKKYNKNKTPAPYACLGFASPISYEGEAPINFKLKLQNEIPAKYLSKSILYN